MTLILLLSLRGGKTKQSQMISNRGMEIASYLAMTDTLLSKKVNDRRKVSGSFLQPGVKLLP